MERILVGATPRHGALAAINRAISLARRIGAKVHVLFVTPPSGPDGRSAPTQDGDAGRLRLLVQRAQEQGVGIEYFVSEGGYEEEVIRFARDRKITLLVAESADGDGRSPEAQSLKRILHGISCRVELVSPRRSEIQTQAQGEAT